MLITRARRPLLAGLLVALVAAALMTAWWWANDARPCQSSGVADCSGSGLLVALIGVPVALGASVAAFRSCGASSGLLGTLAVLVLTWVLVLLGEAVDPPLALWVPVVGAGAAAYVVLEGRLVSIAGVDPHEGR